MKSGFIETADWVGAFTVVRRANRHRLLVLTYHDILPGPTDPLNPLFGLAVDKDLFRTQMRYIRDHFNPVSLEGVLSWLHLGETLPESAVLVTFDDGHRNVLSHALPVLAELDIPALVFVTAGFLGRDLELTWYETLYSCVMQSRLDVVHVEGRSFRLGSRRERAGVCGDLLELARGMSPEEIDGMLREVIRQLGGAQIGSESADRFTWLSAEDCADLVRHNVAIGAHSLTHPILRTLDGSAAGREILGSKVRLESELHCKVKAFAYPFGEPAVDFTGRDAGLVRDAGFQAAFAASGGLVHAGADPWCLPRVGIGPLSMSSFRFLASGTYSWLKGR